MCKTVCCSELIGTRRLAAIRWQQYRVTSKHLFDQIRWGEREDLCESVRHIEAVHIHTSNVRQLEVTEEVNNV